MSSSMSNRDPRADASVSDFDALRALISRRMRSASYGQGGVQVQRLFKQMDRDSLGVLTLADFRHALPRFNLVDEMPDEKTTRSMFRAIHACAPDPGARGRISLAQLEIFAQEGPLRETARKLWKERGEALVAATAVEDAATQASLTPQKLRERHRRNSAARRGGSSHASVARDTLGAGIAAFEYSLRQEDLRVKGSVSYTPSRSRRKSLAVVPAVTPLHDDADEFVFGAGALVVERERRRSVAWQQSTGRGTGAGAEAAAPLRMKETQRARSAGHRRPRSGDASFARSEGNGGAASDDEPTSVGGAIRGLRSEVRVFLLLHRIT